MADTDTEEQKRIAYLQSLQDNPPPPEQIGKDAYPIEQVAAFQRGMADQAVAASRNQPNAIPETTNPDFGNTRAVDYAQRGLPMGNTLVGDVDPNAPKTGFYTNQAGENLGNVQHGVQSPQGATGIQGVLSPQEQAFWAAHPNGAVKDPQTGNLIGLGSSDAYRQNTLQNVFPDPAPQPQKPPDFVHIPEVNPALIAQRQQIQNEIATTQNQLRTASTIGSKKQPSQYQILNQKLNTLTQANNSLGLEHYRQSEQQRKASDLNTKYQDKYLTNQDVMSANKEISQIQATPGSADYKRQYFQIVNEKYPKAMDDPIFKASAERTALSHDERSAARERAVAAGYTVEDTGVGQKGVSQKFVAPAAVSQQQAITKATQKKIGDDFAKSGLTPEQFSQRGAVVGTDKEGKQVPNADATHMKVEIGGHQALMPVETFNRLNGAYPAANANPAAQPDYPGQVQKGNIDLSNRPKVQNPDGRVSTEKSFSIGTDKGEVLIPQVVGGRMLSKEDAISHYRQTGEHLGVFKDIPSANAAADKIHNRDQSSNAPAAAPQGTRVVGGKTYAWNGQRWEPQ